MNKQERFYNLRLPLQLFAWFQTFDKTERSHILRCFIALMIEMTATPGGISQIKRWANGQAPLTLRAPIFFKGIPVPREPTAHTDQA